MLLTDTNTPTDTLRTVKLTVPFSFLLILLEKNSKQAADMLRSKATAFSTRFIYKNASQS